APQTGNGFGCRIARFRWQNGATLGVGDVDVYAPNPGGLGHTPCLDRTNGLVAVRYFSGQTGLHQTGLHWVALYHRADFLDRDFTAISRTTQPDPPATVQGWALLADDVTFAL